MLPVYLVLKTCYMRCRISLCDGVKLPGDGGRDFRMFLPGQSIPLHWDHCEGDSGCDCCIGGRAGRAVCSGANHGGRTWGTVATMKGDLGGGPLSQSHIWRCIWMLFLIHYELITKDHNWKKLCLLCINPFGRPCIMKCTVVCFLFAKLPIKCSINQSINQIWVQECYVMLNDLLTWYVK